MVEQSDLPAVSVRGAGSALTSKPGDGANPHDLGIILHMVKGGVLGVEDADRAKAKLEARRFRMAFESFHALIEDGRDEHS